MEIEKSIAALCRYYTDLRREDVRYLEGMSVVLKTLANLQDADVFIDCPTREGDAIVVAEAKPDYVPSSYRKTVVGLLAKPQNEPAVARTLRLGVATKQMKALTQENTHVIQTVEPINNEGRIIGVLICEQRVDEERTQNSETLHFSTKSYRKIARAITHMTADDVWLTECIDEALVLVDKNGVVSYRNSLAEKLYKKLGFVKDILGQQYKNISLVSAEPPEDDDGGMTETQVSVGELYLAVRRIALNPGKDHSFALVVRDITEQKEREKEIILKSVAIQEMHHRVKNNLQTVASLLRLQIRRASDHETRKVLQESMNRILTIAVTHEILSQVGVDSVNLGEVIVNIRNNTMRYFADSGNNAKVEVTLEGDDFKVDANTATSIALVVNELLQNSLEHGFNDRESGMVRIVTKKGELYSSIQVIDNGCGFDTKDKTKVNLGLNIVKALVKDKLGGSFTLNSDGGGTHAEFDFKII